MTIDINAPKKSGFDAADALAAGWSTADVVAWAKPRTAVYYSAPKAVAAEMSESPSSVGQLEQAVPYSEDALALEFTRRHASHMRYVAAWGEWKNYNGKVWESDSTLLAFDFARAVCREAAETCPEGSRKVISSAKTVAAVERLARAERRHTATLDQWDMDPALLNTPTGVVDLKTCQIRRHCATDYLTKITKVSPGGHCPVWHEFLNRITGGDEDLEAYLQRMVGYALTGLTTEHAIFFLYGKGANGKSVFLNTIAGILGEGYHKLAPIETFTASNNDRHPTELAMLRGARLVTAIETEEGRRWAESKIKSLTGGDPITARFMRGDFFTFQPTFKLMVAGNHRPGLRSVDESIRRRFHLVPFAVTIPKDERDPELATKLRAEWPGILQWAIDGCREWQRLGGLNPPAAVTKATADYLEAEDALATWIEDCCELDGSSWAGSGELFASWTAWADRAAEYAGTQRRFSEKLESRGLAPKRKTGGVRGFIGIRLKPQDQIKPYWDQ